MSSVRQTARPGKCPRMTATQCLRFGPESVAKYSRAFSKSVFLKEVGASLDSLESIIALTDDQKYCEKFVEVAAKRFESTFYVVSNRMKTRHVQSKSIQCPVLTVKDLFVNLKHIPSRSCVIFDNLWLIAHPFQGGLMEQILVSLPKQCVIVLASRPFSNITVFYHWLSNICQGSLRIIEAPFERCPLSYYALTEEPKQMRLIRNSALCIDALELRDAFSVTKNDFVSMNSIEWVIEELLSNGSGPVLVVVPCESYLSGKYESVNSDTENLEDVIAKFERNDKGVLFATVKVAESVFISAHSIVLASLLKYDGIECREMKPFELYHLIRSAGRVGIDTQGYVVAYLSKQLNEDHVLQALSADLPSLNPKFSVQFHSFLNGQFCDIKDMDDLANRTFNGFCQTQVLPILKDQLTCLESMRPPQDVSADCERIHEIETAISTLCTHPQNIRKLLINGRVVRVGLAFGESSWGVCYGSSLCGTVTVAMKNTENRRPNEDVDKCLVTVPISEVLSVSSAVTCLQYQEFEDTPFVIESDYPLYDGDELVVGRERLSRLHQALKDSIAKLEASVLSRWKEISETVSKIRYLAYKVETMSSDIGLGQHHEIARDLKKGHREGSDVILSVLQRVTVPNGMLLKTIIESGVVERSSPKEVALLLLLTGSHRAELGLNRKLPRELEEILSFAPDSGALLTAGALWCEEALPSTYENWTVACLFKRVARIAKCLHSVTADFGLSALAEKFGAAEKYVTSHPNFRGFFSK